MKAYFVFDNVSLRLLAAILAVLCISGCASKVNGPAANTSIEEARSFRPPPGQSGIYVIRPGGILGAAGTWAMNLDVEYLGDLPVNQYLYATVPPGEHLLQGGHSEHEGLDFRTEPNKNYFFTISAGFGGPVVSMMSEENGRQLVEEMSR